MMLSASLLVPFAAPLGCGGEACCEMQMEELMHHGEQVAIDGIGTAMSCPMLACGVVSSALTIATGSVVPDVIADETEIPSLTMMVTSVTVRPHTPPPRA